MNRWYALYTKPNVEHQVAAALQGRGIDTFLPEVESARTGGRVPFFPCYLFIRVDFQRVSVSSVQWMPGLRRVVAYGDRPVPLTDEVVGLIRRKLARINAAGGWQETRFQPGQRVRVKRGPLQGLSAIFEGPSTPAERVQVLLNFLGQERRVHLAVDDLEEPRRRPGAGPKPKRPRRSRGRGRPIKRS